MNRIAAATALSLFTSQALAGAGTITVLDSTGTTKTYDVITDISGNFLSKMGICDQAAGATCVSVGTAGAPSTNALTVQAITLGNGASANAARVTLSNDSTGILAAVTAITDPVTVAQATAANLNATVTGTVTATLANETTKVIGTVRALGNVGGVLDAVTGATVPANALQVGMAQGGNLIAMTGTGGNLNVQCANCSGSGVSVVDAAGWTTASSVFAPGGGVFNDTAAVLSSGTQGTFRVTPNRGLHTNLRNQAGAEVGVAAVPLQVSLANTAANATAVSVSLASNQSVNEAQINGVTPLMGNGASGTGSQRVNLSNDNTAIANWGQGATAGAVPTGAQYVGMNVGGNLVGLTGTGTNLNVNCQVGCGAATSITGWAGGTLGAMANYGTSPGAVLVPGVNAFVTNATPLGQTTKSASSPVTLASDQIGDPCTWGVKTNVAINTTGTQQIVAPSGATQVYVCSIMTVGATASIQNLVGGTGATCATGTPAAVIGSTTPANGMSFAANGGFSYGSGAGTVARTTTAGHGLCLIQSASAQISGNATIVQQ